MGERVRSVVVAYDTDDPRAIELADRYDVALAAVDPGRVLAVAG